MTKKSYAEEMRATLTFKKDTPTIYNHVRKQGETLEYKPWDYSWQGMYPFERHAKGIYVICHGHGEFEVHTEEDVEVQEHK
jgi:hypothetical protein